MLQKTDQALYAASDRIIAWVGTPWCSLAFLGLSLVSLPGALASHDPVVIVGWVAQTCLQLVLLAVLQTGQNRSSARLEAVILETHDTVLAEVAELKQMHAESRAAAGSKPAEGRGVTDSANV